MENEQDVAKDSEILLDEEKNDEQNTEDKSFVRFLPCKLTSFFYFGGKYLLMTYLVPFFISINLHPAQAGVIISLRYFLQVIGGVSLSAVADRTKKHTFIALFAIIAATCSMIAMPIIPQTYLSAITTPDSHTSNTLNTTITRSNNLTGEVLFNSSRIDKNPVFYKNNNIKTKKVELASSNIFIICIIFSLIYAIFDGSLNGMVDAITISYCDYYGDKNSYYWQRLWGSVGYATVPLLGGILLDNLKYVNKYVEFIPVFYMFYGLQIILFSSFIFMLIAYSKIKERDHHPDILRALEIERKPSRHRIIKTITNSKIMICLVLQIAFGIGTGIEFSYLLLYMENYMTDGSKSILGFAVLSQCLTEAIFSPLLGKITKIIKDPYVCMSLGLAGYALGFFFYYCATSGIHIIFINIIYGFAYLMFNFPAQAECYRLCPKKYLTVLFSLSASCYTGIGCAIGGLLGGLLYERNGPRDMYLITSFMFQSATALLAIYCVFQFKKRRSLGRSDNDLLKDAINVNVET